MRLFAPADLSGPSAQAGEKRGEIAAHKYEGSTSCQRAIPRARKDYGEAAACGYHKCAERDLEIRNRSKREDQEIIFRRHDFHLHKLAVSHGFEFEMGEQ